MCYVARMDDDHFSLLRRRLDEALATLNRVKHVNRPFNCGWMSTPANGTAGVRVLSEV
jgi:hypothetical protein